MFGDRTIFVQIFLVIVWYVYGDFWWLCDILWTFFFWNLMACVGHLMRGKSIGTKLLQCSVNSGLTPQGQQGQEHQHVSPWALNNGHRSHGIRGLHRGWRWVSRLLMRSYGIPYGFTYDCPTRRQDEVTQFEVGLVIYTMWGPLVISWFISPSNYSHKYHRP